jgi:putative peptide zinc metalloprotease protein
MLSIILFVAQQYFVIGVILAIWALIGTLVWPNLKMLAKTWQDSDIRSGRRSPTVMIPVSAGIIILLLGIIPLPLTTTVEGVVQMPENRRVLAGENCFIAQLHKQAGEAVHKDELLVSCENRQLRTEQLVLQQQYAEASTQRQGVWDDPVQLKIYDDELSRLSSELKESQKRLQFLSLSSQAEGIWTVRDAADLPGRFVRRGDLIGYVITDNDITVRGMIPESDIELVREHVTALHARKASDLSIALTPASWYVFPAATKEPVSEILTEAAGGDIVMDPAASGSPQALRRYFIVALEFDRLPATHVDERIYLQFEHPPEAIIYRVYRLVRRTFLEYFDV